MLATRLSELNGIFYPGSPNNTRLKLYMNDVTPDANSVLASFTEADYVGYADVALTMGAVGLNNQNLPVSQSNLCSFQPSAAGWTGLVYGIYIVDVSSNLICAQRFDNPEPMDTELSIIKGVWRTSEPLTNYGWISVE